VYCATIAVQSTGSLVLVLRARELQVRESLAPELAASRLWPEALPVSSTVPRFSGKA